MDLKIMERKPSTDKKAECLDRIKDVVKSPSYSIFFILGIYVTSVCVLTTITQSSIETENYPLEQTPQEHSSCHPNGCG